MFFISSNAIIKNISDLCLWLLEPTSVFLPGKFYGQRNLAGYSLWGHKSQTRLSNYTTTWHRVAKILHIWSEGGICYTDEVTQDGGWSAGRSTPCQASQLWASLTLGKGIGLGTELICVTKDVITHVHVIKFQQNLWSLNLCGASKLVNTLMCWEGLIQKKHSWWSIIH